MQSISAKRKNDAILQLVQDNAAHEIRVISMNHAAEMLTGYEASSLVGNSFLPLLPPSIAEECEEISYDASGVALFDVLHHHFLSELRHKSGHFVPVDMKAFVLPGTQKEFQVELLLHDITLFEQLRALKQTLLTAQKSSVLDDALQLPNRSFLQQSILHTQHAMRTVPVDCVFATLLITELAPAFSGSLANARDYAFLRAAGERLKQTFRSEDMVGYLGGAMFGVVLVDCRVEHMAALSKRLHSSFTRTPLTTPEGNHLNATLSLSYDRITVEEEPAMLVERVMERQE